MRNRDCEDSGPCDEKMPSPPSGGMMPQAMCEAPERKPNAGRKSELFQLAQGIAAQVEKLTHRRERCLLRQMVEMLLD